MFLVFFSVPALGPSRVSRIVSCSVSCSFSCSVLFLLFCALSGVSRVFLGARSRVLVSSHALSHVLRFLVFRALSLPLFCALSRVSRVFLGACSRAISCFSYLLMLCLVLLGLSCSVLFLLFWVLFCVSRVFVGARFHLVISFYQDLRCFQCLFLIYQCMCNVRHAKLYFSKILPQNLQDVGCIYGGFPQK